jgi:hypothetical protein
MLVAVPRRDRHTHISWPAQPRPRSGHEVRLPYYDGPLDWSILDPVERSFIEWMKQRETATNEGESRQPIKRAGTDNLGPQRQYNEDQAHGAQDVGANP